MANKRFMGEEEQGPDGPAEKRLRPRPSLASVFGEVAMVNSLQHLSSALEPLLRKMVREESEHIFTRYYTTNPVIKAPSRRLHAPEPQPTLQLTFAKPLKLPIFTGCKILDSDDRPIQILLVGTNPNRFPAALPNPIRVEIVVLDGDFPSGDSWTSEEFGQKTVKERDGKRPLLTGDVNVTVRDGSVVVGDLELTDNSSWIRSRRFRLGARVVSGSEGGVRVREAVTEAFVVKDHRGELYKKHHPPSLEDQVWRLEKIGKEGAFHRKLASQGINNVRDFLKLSVVDQPKLRTILGAGMSEKMWEVTIKHARECVLGSKKYVYVSECGNFTLHLNPICQVVKATVHGRDYLGRELSIINPRDIEKLVKEAHQNWDSLEQVHEVVNETTLSTQGEMAMIELNGYQIDENKPMKINEYISNNEHEAGSSNWQQLGSGSNYIDGSVFESGFRFGSVFESGFRFGSPSTPPGFTFFNGG